jgi:hypothetical protein
MTSMIEQVAKRMFEEWLAEPDTVRDQAKNGPHPEWEAQSEIGRRRWLNYARAAIEAMREPTKAMRYECDGWNASPNDMEGCYQAMIDAALNEEPTA